MVQEKISTNTGSKKIPHFRTGDQVKVHAKVIEGENERIQVFEGVVISRRGSGPSETFAVRKVSFGVGVERIFPLHSPRIDKIEMVRPGRVRRAKLFYLRKRKGKAAHVESGEQTGPVTEAKQETQAPEKAGGADGELPQHPPKEVLSS